MGEAWRLEFGDEKGERSLARWVLERREEVGSMLLLNGREGRVEVIELHGLKVIVYWPQTWGKWTRLRLISARVRPTKR